jgi:hypothetical protein
MLFFYCLGIRVVAMPFRALQVLAKKDLTLLSLYATSALIQITLGIQFWIYR